MNPEYIYKYESENSHLIIGLSGNHLLSLLTPGLSHEFNNNYQFDRNDKMNLVAHLKKEIQECKTPDDIKKFWDKNKDSHYLNQRRHGLFDQLLFRGKDYMTASKQAIYKAATEKGQELSGSATFKL